MPQTMPQLTTKEEVLCNILLHAGKKGLTVKEVQRQLQGNKISTVYTHLNALAVKGYVQKDTSQGPKSHRFIVDEFSLTKFREEKFDELLAVQFENDLDSFFSFSRAYYLARKK